MLKNKVRAFTLLECLVSLLVIAGSLTIYQGLTKSLNSHITHLSTHDDEEWLLFCQQLRQEWDGASFDKIENQKICLTKNQKALAFGKYKKDDFRKTSASGRGYQPMIYHVKAVTIEKTKQIVTLKLSFDGGQERSFVYAFKEKS
ncbi:competence type IV pilus minor pilin ComGF [Streptococcus pacificus]|uniref:Prepilin-type N-terminal cleavage/methylation domain-containing protein n=1 Tax=Streptococcus pacificus TaxID=2740577 RepID=A0ABS0ZK36_9STRE|nr:competence type IV pilus minor pilin ComGF [Streptococcus pacificus]MBJ8326374.1 prepilin-type N-terminal cleavage/methylation domain-containing protein [Streptococcus pacificus]